MEYGMYIAGGGPTKETIEEVRATLNDILGSANAEKVKTAALKALVALAGPAGPTTITGCHIDGSSTQNHYAAPDENNEDDAPSVD